MAMSTPQLRTAWKDYECAREKMKPIDFLGDTILVAPPSEEGWQALAAVLRSNNYDVRTKDTDSYNCRKITGGTEKSLHSYGIALDINWQTNPYIDHQGTRKVRYSPRALQEERALDVKAAKADTDMTPTMVADVMAIRTKDGKQVFDWGGHWDKVKDSMHFEMDLGPEDLAAGIDWSTVNGERELTPPASAARFLPQAETLRTSEPAAPYSDAFLRCHVIIEKWEGGFVNHPQDPGGATNMGITQKVLADWRGRPVSVQEVRDISREEARRIFYARYWRPLRCDDLPLPLALMTYNCAVNSGPRRGGEFLQIALNNQGANLEVDGRIGQLSTKAAAGIDVAKAVQDYGDIYEAFYRGLGTFGTFGNGWMNRLTEVLTHAASWLTPPLPISPLVQPTSVHPTSPPLKVPGFSTLLGGPVMPLPPAQKEMTFIDKALGGEVMKGKKTFAAAAAYAAAMLLHENNVFAVGDDTYNMVVQLIGLYGGLGLASKLERSGNPE